MNKRLVSAGVLALLLLGWIPGFREITFAGWVGPPVAERGHAARRHVAERLAHLPLVFVPNAGQADPSVRYESHGLGYALYFTRAEAVFALDRHDRRPARHSAVAPVSLGVGSSRAEPAGHGVVLGLLFVGANPDVSVEGHGEAAGRFNYLGGNDPANWRRGLSGHREIVYRELWPGIDLVFRGADGYLKYEFLVRPGATVDAIRLAYRGAERLSLDPAGNLLIETAAGVLTDRRPSTYQQVDGRQVAVDSRFVLKRGPEGQHAYGFEVAAYDARRPLIIDPGLAYSTFLGGNSGDIAFSIAVDAFGAVYVTGITTSRNFPVTPGARAFAGFCDVFVTKLDAAGSRLVYSTFLGGSGCDQGNSIAVDGAGHAYVGGSTPSINFPTTEGAFARARAGSTDGFVTKLDADGNIVYSTYLGGSGFDSVTGIAVDAGGAIYVSGPTTSTNFPTTPQAFDRTCGTDGLCNRHPRFGFLQSDAFVAKLDPGMAGPASLIYSTYLGGSASEGSVGIAVDPSGSAHVMGRTDSPDFPTTNNAFDQTYNSPPGDFFRGGDIFVTRLDPTGSRLLYSTFLGGGGTEESGGIALDRRGNVYVTGSVISTNCCRPPFVSDFPTTPGAFSRTFNGFVDLFVAKLDPAKAGPDSLVYATFLGGTGTDGIGLLGTTGGIAVDHAGHAYVTGATTTLDFPTTPGAFARELGRPFGFSTQDAFLAKLDPAGSRLLYSTYFGGACGDFGFSSDNGVAIAVDPAGNAYLAGITMATTFPTTPGAFDRTINSIGFQGVDTFVAKLATTPQGQIEVLASDVAGLVATGAIEQGRGSALTAPLRAAIQQLERGAGAAALNTLESFISEIIALIRAEALPAATGQPLIDDARAVIDLIKYLGA